MKSKTLQEYQEEIKQFDKNLKNGDEFTSVLILAILEELGEMARAYLAKIGRKPTNVKAQKDESYREELGDIMVTIIRLAGIKDIDLDERINYTIKKIKNRKTSPKI